jgi:rhodanese-related sulfurtransferase
VLWLREQGFERAQSLAGGIERWAQIADPSMAHY